MPTLPPVGAAWVMTFADLMSLLMCFFVLLLSFSEMDALKFKRLAGELREAFGVQTLINVSDPPKGTSVIAGISAHRFRNRHRSMKFARKPVILPKVRWRYCARMK